MMLVPTEVYSRVAGYFRPVNQWNNGKRSEMEDRKTLNIKEIENVISKKIKLPEVVDVKSKETV